MVINFFDITYEHLLMQQWQVSSVTNLKKKSKATVPNFPGKCHLT